MTPARAVDIREWVARADEWRRTCERAANVARAWAASAERFAAAHPRCLEYSDTATSARRRATWALARAIDAGDAHRAAVEWAEKESG